MARKGGLVSAPVTAPQCLLRSTATPFVLVVAIICAYGRLACR
jgi:hypothetical protein